MDEHHGNKREIILQTDTVGVDTPAMRYLLDLLEAVEDEKRRRQLKRRVASRIGKIQYYIGETRSLEYGFRRTVLSVLLDEHMAKSTKEEPKIESLIQNVLQTLIKRELEYHKAHGRSKRPRREEFPRQKHGAPTFHSM